MRSNSSILSSASASWALSAVSSAVCSISIGIPHCDLGLVSRFGDAWRGGNPAKHLSPISSKAIFSLPELSSEGLAGGAL